MKLLVVGAGFTGCSLARLMKDRNYQVSIIEKLNHIGGLCYSKKNAKDLLYEPYGAHIFHTKNDQVKAFVQQFSNFSSYIHKKGIIINGVLRSYPLSLELINEIPEKDKILKELNERPLKPDNNNFETCLISLFGKSLYQMCFYNYSKKMWGIEPKELVADWVQNRVELRETNSELFNEQWQGIPSKGYTNLFKNMISDIPLKYNKNFKNEAKYDLVLFSGRIDELLQYEFGILPYRSLCFEYRYNETWNNEDYGTINLPQHQKYIRKANFNVIYQRNNDYSCIQYQKPIPVENGNLPMYPIHTKKNLDVFDKYLRKACKSDRIIPVGRLGLYKYLDMDKAVSFSMNLIPLIESWKGLSSEKRYFELKSLINKY